MAFVSVGNEDFKTPSPDSRIVAVVSPRALGTNLDRVVVRQARPQHQLDRVAQNVGADRVEGVRLSELAGDVVIQRILDSVLPISVALGFVHLIE